MAKKVRTKRGVDCRDCLCGPGLLGCWTDDLCKQDQDRAYKRFIFEPVDFRAAIRDCTDTDSINQEIFTWKVRNDP